MYSVLSIFIIFSAAVGEAINSPRELAPIVKEGYLWKRGKFTGADLDNSGREQNEIYSPFFDSLENEYKCTYIYIESISCSSTDV